MQDTGYQAGQGQTHPRRGCTTTSGAHCLLHPESCVTAAAALNTVKSRRKRHHGRYYLHRGQEQAFTYRTCPLGTLMFDSLRYPRPPGGAFPVRTCDRQV